MPAALELLLEALLDVFSCVFEVCDLVLDHLHVDVLGYLKGVLFHVYLHVAELDIDGYLQIGGYPVLGDAGPGKFFIIGLAFLLLAFSLF
jgi:hypothetical protein